MRALGTSLAIGILAVAVGCGGSSGTSNDGGTGGTGGPVQGTYGGAAGAGGIPAGGTGGSSGSCNLPSCLTSTTITGCEPSGTCVTQADATGLGSNDCYANGVKVISGINLAAGAFTITYKKGTTTCYSIQASADATGNATFTLKNASGGVIGSGTEDSTSSAVTFTCAGGTPVTVDPNCDTSSIAGSASSSSSCTPGTCTP